MQPTENRRWTSNLNLKKVLIAYGSLVVLLAVGTWLWRTINTGVISITATGKDNDITITNTKNSRTVKQGQEKLAARLPAGSYQVTVHGKVLAVSKRVQLARGKHLTYQFTAPAVVGSEPVIGLPAKDVSADASQLYYVNTDAGGLYRIDTRNQSSFIAGSLYLTTVRWISAGYGIGADDQGGLYVVNNQVAVPLQTPHKGGIPVYAVTPEGTIYLVVGHDIYVGSTHAAFKRIYTASGTPSQLVAASQGVLVLYRPTSEQKAQITLVGSDGQPSASAQLTVTAAAWSPNGKFLAITDGTTGQILDSSLHQVAPLPEKDTTTLAWLNNDSLLYSSDNLLWTYSLSKGAATVLTGFALGIKVSQLTIDTEGKYVYVERSGLRGQELDRIPLSRQAISTTAAQLGVFFPTATDETNNCLVNYVNFTQPTLLVKVTRGASLTDCQSQVTNILNNDALGANGLTVNYDVASAGGD